MNFRKWVFLTLCGLTLQCTDSEPVPSNIPESEVIRIPVVVHILYSSPLFNISDEKIRSQIEVLNQDFRKKNVDWIKTPEEFRDRVADVGIEFELATIDPFGKSTNGITRTYTDVDGWAGVSFPDRPVEDRALYFTEKGGHDAWPTNRYLNIWVAELSNRFGDLGLAGYAQLPGQTDYRIDGVVIDPRVFGTLPPLAQGHLLGRTATHEIGHWLNLKHIFGVDANCGSLDEVDDTPPAANRYEGNPTFPQVSCGVNSMFMNFMDLVHDDAMYMFTKGQRGRMRKQFNEGGARRALYLNSR